MDEAEEVRYFGTYELVPDAAVATSGRPAESATSAEEAARLLGYVPLRDVTGVADVLGPLWPSQHRQWCNDLGPALGEDENDEGLDRWLVQSPWPALTVPQVLSVLWRWVERDPYPHDRGRWSARVEEVLSWDETAAQRLLDGQ